jgi:hypothetical protein
MKSDEAEGRLLALLAAAGIDPERPAREDVARTWEVMRAFYAEAVDGGEPLYELDITRQLSFEDEDGEYDHMAQLQCTFAFSPTDALRAIPPANLWSWDAEDFFTEALALPGFRAVEELGLTPTRLVVEYSDV